MKRSKQLLSFGAILLLLASLLTSLIPPVRASAVDGPPGQAKWSPPISITTCQELRNVNNDLEATYVLANNLSCIGFISIGRDEVGNPLGSFKGRFYGQGHTVSNLGTSLFYAVEGGIIANLTLSINRTAPSGDIVGLLADVMSGLIIDVHVSGTITMNAFFAGAGGLIGQGSQIHVIRSSADITAQIGGGQAQYGGLAGYLTDGVIRDSYARSTMVVSGGVEHAAGLVIYGNGTQVNNSYASGTINNPGNVHEIGGLIWYGTGAQVTNSFSKFQGVGGCNGTNGCSGLVTVTDPDMDLSTNYFDQTAAGTNKCDGTGTLSCNRVNVSGAQPNYFNNNSINPPLSGWDFTNVWATSVSLPTLRLPSDPSPEPGAVQQPTSAINTSTSVSLAWTLPADMGSAPILAEEIYYQKVGETEWQRASGTFINSYSSPSANFTGSNKVISNLSPSTNYNFEIVLYNQDGYISTNTVSGVTGTPGLTLVKDCQQLQSITNSLVDNFELGQNIDCSDSVNWNGGDGFIPIGCNPEDQSNHAFTGVFAGNNYTISNLYIDGSSSCYQKALFGATLGALVQDFTMVDPVINLSAGNGYAAPVSATDAGSTFSNIHVRGDFIGDEHLIAAGLVDYIDGDSSGTTINRSSFVGSVSGDLSIHFNFGGFVRSGSGPLTITDSYVQAALYDVGNVDGTFIGGLVSTSNGNLHISNSYASISYDAADSSSTFADDAFVAIGGLVAEMQAGYDLSINHTFARTSVQNFSGDRSTIGGAFGALLKPDSTQPDVPVDVNNTYFDEDLIGTDQCAGRYPGDDIIYTQPTSCNSISGQPNYFYNNSTNPPLDSWDFDNIWATTSTLPVFSRKALTTITPIPATRLTPKTTPATPVKVTIPAQPISPDTKIAQLREDRAQTAVTTESIGPQGIIEQLKQLLNRVPTSVLVSFPYLLFGLLLLAALALLVEMMRQAKRLKQLNLLLAKQRSVAEKRDTFWHLAANYLRAPITLLMGGADLLALSKLDNAETRQLTSLSQRLQTKVAGIMQQIEQSHTLQGIKPPKAEKPRRVWMSVGFWLPVVIVAILIILTNYVAQSWRGLNLSTINLATQFLFFLLASIALYWVLGALGVVSGQRRNAERLLAQQERALDTARLHLMSQTATDLDTDVSRIQALLAKLSTRSEAKPIMQEGASRLRHLVDSFSLLISAQNHRLGSLSPIGAQTSLEKVLKSVLTELEPEITAKGLTIDAPAKLNFHVPGKASLNSQVLNSVLANAIAFSPSGSTVRIDVEQSDSGVRLKVADHGPGISSTQQTHLFEPFTKADGLTGLQLDHDGLGINLYLDRQIMDYLGGQITVNSTAGQGTEVEMSWPRVAPKVVHPGAVVHPSPS